MLFALLAMLACTGAGRAQDSLGARLSIDRLGDIQTGAFAAGGVRFTLDRYNDKYLLRFAGLSEIFVLYPDHGSLGGRLLRYDSGETALAVSGWGAMTIYTDTQPSGLPAERAGDSSPPALAPVTLLEMQNAADDEGEHLGYAHGLHLSFTADWAALATDAALRALAFDALQNTARGIDRFAAAAAGRLALTARMDGVRMETGGRPTITLHGRTLLVTFVPSQGFAGRASSLGIARALGQMFSVPTAG
jgi:hypothetical protein